MDTAANGFGVLVDFAVTYTLEAACAVQSGTETANSSKHIKVANQIVLASFLLQRKQKAEDIFVNIPGLQLLVFCSKFYVLQFLFYDIPNGFQQNILVVRLTYGPAHCVRSLAGRNCT